MKGMKDRAERMIENYAARLRVGQCGYSRVGDLKGQAERYAAAVARNKRIKTATGAVLAGLDEPTIRRPFYHSFALKLGKIDRDAWGEHAKREEGRILVDTWVSRGLTRVALLRIARDVFKLDLTSVEPPACAPAKAGVESIRD